MDAGITSFALHTVTEEGSVQKLTSGKDKERGNKQF